MTNPPMSIPHGTPFNPYQTFVGSFLPNSLLRCPDLSSSAKLLWARLAQYAGDKGVAFPHQGTLAKELGFKTAKHVRKLLDELEEFGLIDTVLVPGKNGRGQRKLYRFLWHPVFEPQPVSDENLKPYKGAIWPGYKGAIWPGASCTTYKHKRIREEEKADKPPSSHKRLTRLWCALWKDKYQAKYPFKSKDGIILASILKASNGDLSCVRKIVKRYLRCRDPFFRGHPLNLLQSQLPKFLVADEQEETDSIELSAEAISSRDTVWAQLQQIDRARCRKDELGRLLQAWQDWYVAVRCRLRKWKKTQANEAMFVLGEGPEALSAVLSVENGAEEFRHRFCKWLVSQVQEWSGWEGSLSEFFPGRRHWSRFLMCTAKQEGMKLSQKDWSILHEAT